MEVNSATLWPPKQQTLPEAGVEFIKRQACMRAQNLDTAVPRTSSSEQVSEVGQGRFLPADGLGDSHVCIISRVLVLEPLDQSIGTE